MPGESVPIFTVESLQTPEGLSDLNRILQVFSDNVAGDTDTVRIYQGFGTPEGAVTAGIGSVFQRLDGATGTAIYVKESGTGATGWSNGLVPSGTIVIWSGAISAIPDGWVICDGNNSTPDLTDRFVIHADADSGGTNNKGDTGGASTHKLTGGESGTSAHLHPVDGHRWVGQSNGGNVAGTNHSDVLGTGTTSNSTEANADDFHTNRDKFHALAYIMKE